MYKRFRNRRVDVATRQQFRETVLTGADFIWPVFCIEGSNRREPIAAMPGVFRLSADCLIRDLELLVKSGLKSILVFGVPDTKGVERAWQEDGLVQQVLQRVKKEFPTLEVISDVCICSYTKDGHCHIGDNDATCEVLAKIAVSHARSGADCVAPSAMMDGQVYHIRKALNVAGLESTQIISYSAKYASNYYGPFREAADCVPQHGDRSTYQMDPANSQEALEEVGADIEEGATAVIVKPALAYLDIIAKVKERFSCPVIGYNVSGEYAMLKNAVDSGIVKKEIVWESLVSIKRAGAERIISYFTPDVLLGRISL